MATASNAGRQGCAVCPEPERLMLALSSSAHLTMTLLVMPYMRRVGFWMFLVAVPVAAQPQVPDDLDPELFAPLAVGNVWEYAIRDHYQNSVPGTYVRFEVLPSIEHDGLAYGVMEVVQMDTNRVPLWTNRCGFRDLDEPILERIPLSPQEGGTFANCASHLPLPPERYALLYPDTTVKIGSVPYPVDALALAVTEWQAPMGAGGRFEDWRAQGIGSVFYSGSWGDRRSGSHRYEFTLVHAHVNGVTYGSIPSRPEPPVHPAPSDLEVSAYPNPFARSLNVTLHASTGMVRLELFDLLGRRILEREISAVWPHQQFRLDVPPGPRELLFLRVTDGANRTRTIGVIRAVH